MNIPSKKVKELARKTLGVAEVEYDSLDKKYYIHLYPEYKCERWDEPCIIESHANEAIKSLKTVRKRN